MATDMPTRCLNLRWLHLFLPFGPTWKFQVCHLKIQQPVSSKGTLVTPKRLNLAFMLSWSTIPNSLAVCNPRIETFDRNTSNRNLLFTYSLTSWIKTLDGKTLLASTSECSFGSVTLLITVLVGPPYDARSWTSSFSFAVIWPKGVPFDEA